jgi:hypothetical protein
MSINKEVYDKKCKEIIKEIKTWSTYRLSKALIEQDEILYENKLGDKYMARAIKQIITNEINLRTKAFSNMKPL